MTIAITRTDLDAGGLRAAATRAKDAAAARRMLALALVMEGQNRTEAACAAGMDRQTLRDWVHRYNAQGLHGLTNRPNRGAPKRKLPCPPSPWGRQGARVRKRRGTGRERSRPPHAPLHGAGGTLFDRLGRRDGREVRAELWRR